MKKSTLLYPRFLQKIDLYLVKKYPLIWSIRAHYFLYYSLLSCLVLGGLAMLTPIGMNDLDYHSNSVSISISSILAITVACFWVYKTVIFDKQRQFGQRKITDEYISFILSFITLVGMWSIMFSYAGVLEAKRRSIVSDQELIEDVNTANLAQLFMVKTSDRNNNYEGKESTSNIPIPVGSLILNKDFEYFINYNLYSQKYKSEPNYIEPIEPERTVIDGINTSEVIRQKALKIKTKEQVYIVLNMMLNLSTKYDIYNSDENYNHYVRLSFDDMKRHYDASFSALNKSSGMATDSVAKDESIETENHSSIWNEAENFKTLLNSRLSTISSYKYGHRGFFDFNFLIISFYFLLGICILLHIFKNVRWRQFIVFLVVACLLPIIYRIFGLIFARGGGAESYGKLCYYGTFFYGVVHIILAYDRKDYSLWNIVGIMIFNVMVLTVPLFTFLFLEFKLFNNDDNFNDIMYIIQIIETIFYIIFMLPMLKRIYERVYALPRN